MLFSTMGVPLNHPKLDNFRVETHVDMEIRDFENPPWHVHGMYL